MLVNCGCQHVDKCAIQSFNQTVTLRVIGCGVELVNVQPLAYSLYDVGFKLASLVQVEFFWYQALEKEFLAQPACGPYTVEKKLSTIVYRIQDTSHGRRRNCQIVHFDRLKPCAPSTRIPDGIKHQTSSKLPENPAPNPVELRHPSPHRTELQLLNESSERPVQEKPKRMRQTVQAAKSDTLGRL